MGFGWFAYLGAVNSISLNTVYDANVLQDHRGAQFDRHQGACIPQKDMRDRENRLIPPWRVRTEFRPGTLVIAQVKFRMWLYNKEGLAKTSHVSCLFLSAFYEVGLTSSHG